MTEQPTPQKPIDAPKASEENGTQDINPTTKTEHSYTKKISSATVEAEPKDTQTR